MFSFFRHIELTCQDILDIKDEDKSTCDEVQVFHELKDTDQFISLYQVDLILEKHFIGFYFNCIS